MPKKVLLNLSISSETPLDTVIPQKLKAYFKCYDGAIKLKTDTSPYRKIMLVTETVSISIRYHQLETLSQNPDTLYRTLKDLSHIAIVQSFKNIQHKYYLTIFISPSSIGID